MKLKPSEYILGAMILVIGIYCFWVNINQDKIIGRNGELMRDTRELLFGSLEDVDTLVFEDRFIIYERGYDSRQKIIHGTQDNKAEYFQWFVDSETVEEMGDNDKYVEDIDFIDTIITKGN